MPNPNVTEAKEEKTKDSSQTQEQEINLYIGVFFDGTGANKFQMMLGKKRRIDEMFKKYEKFKVEYKRQFGNDHAPYDFKNGYEMLDKGREYLEKLNIFTISELDKLYFGYSSKHVEARIMENCSTQSNGNLLGGVASMPNKSDFRTTTILNKVATELYEEKKEDEGHYASSVYGTPAEDETYTNVAILESCYKGVNNGNDYYIPFYVEGVGSDMQFMSSIPHKGGHVLDGFAKGVGHTGVLAKVTKMFKMINRKLNDLRKDNLPFNLYFDVFGFSRGATEARIFTYIVTDCCDDCSKIEKMCGFEKPFCGMSIKEKKVRFLGIFDTVSSIGAIRNLSSSLNVGIGTIIPVLFKTIDFFSLNPPCTYSCQQMSPPREPVDDDAKDSHVWALSKYHDQNVYDYGLYATKKVESVFHICAMDEFRRNFALVDIESSINSNGLELFIPGCHTDIGGAACIGREVKKTIKKRIPELFFYPGGPQTDSYVDTWWPATNLFSKDAVFYPSTFEGLRSIGLINSYETNSDSSDSQEKMKYMNELLSYVETGVTIETENEFDLYRYVKSGYSNIALQLMRTRIQKVIEGNSGFTGGSILPGYPIPNELEKFYSKAKEVVEEKPNGRYFVSPSLKYYQWLRQNYLHLSSNCGETSIQDNDIVNGPSYFEQTYDTSFIEDDSISGVQSNYTTKLTESPTPQISPKSALYFKSIKKRGAFVSRITYSGKKSKSKNEENYHWTFMSDYNPKMQAIISIDECTDKYENISSVNNIERLNDEIESLEKRLDTLSKEFIENIVDNNIAKQISTNPLILLLQSDLNQKKKVRDVLKKLYITSK